MSLDSFPTNSAGVTGIFRISLKRLLRCKDSSLLPVPLAVSQTSWQRLYFTLFYVGVSKTS